MVVEEESKPLPELTTDHIHIDMRTRSYQGNAQKMTAKAKQSGESAQTRTAGLTQMAIAQYTKDSDQS